MRNCKSWQEKATNQAVQPTGASRLAQRAVERHRRLAPVADLHVSRRRYVMHIAPPVQRPSVRMLAVVFSSAGTALVLALGFSLLACSGGFLFSGVSILSTVLAAVAFCAAVTSVTALVFRQRQRPFGWRMLLTEVVVVALVAVGLLSWLDTRQHLRIFLKPSPVPSLSLIHI